MHECTKGMRSARIKRPLTGPALDCSPEAHSRLHSSVQQILEWKSAGLRWCAASWRWWRRWWRGSGPRRPPYLPPPGRAWAGTRSRCPCRSRTGRGRWAGWPAARAPTPPGRRPRRLCTACRRRPRWPVWRRPGPASPAAAASDQQPAARAPGRPETGASGGSSDSTGTPRGSEGARWWTPGRWLSSGTTSPSLGGFSSQRKAAGTCCSHIRAPGPTPGHNRALNPVLLGPRSWTGWHKRATSSHSRGWGATRGPSGRCWCCCCCWEGPRGLLGHLSWSCPSSSSRPPVASTWAPAGRWTGPSSARGPSGCSESGCWGSGSGWASPAGCHSSLISESRETAIAQCPWWVSAPEIRLLLERGGRGWALFYVLISSRGEEMSGADMSGWAGREERHLQHTGGDHLHSDITWFNLSARPTNPINFLSNYTGEGDKSVQKKHLCLHPLKYHTASTVQLREDQAHNVDTVRQCGVRRFVPIFQGKIRSLKWISRG